MTRHAKQRRRNLVLFSDHFHGFSDKKLQYLHIKKDMREREMMMMSDVKGFEDTKSTLNFLEAKTQREIDN